MLGGVNLALAGVGAGSMVAMEIRAPGPRVVVAPVEECSLLEVLTEPRRRANRRARVRKAVALHGVDAVHALWDDDLLTVWQYDQALHA